MLNNLSLFKKKYYLKSVQKAFEIRFLIPVLNIYLSLKNIGTYKNATH